MSSDVFQDRTRRLVIALAIVSLVASVVSMVFGEKLVGAPPSPRDSFTYGPLGHRAFFETMQRLGVRMRRFQEGDSRRIAAPVLFIEPDDDSVRFGGSTFELEEVLEDRRDAGRVSIVVLPKWSLGGLGAAVPEAADRIDAIVEATGLALEVDHHGEVDARPTEDEAKDGDEATFRVALPWPQTVRSTELAPWVSTSKGGLVTCDETGLVCVIADPDILHNSNLQRAEHAEFLVRLLRDELEIDELVVDEVFHGHRIGKSLSRELGEWPGILLLVQGMLVAVCALLMGRRRFGVPEEPEAAHGRGPREVIDVAANVLALGQSPASLALAYVEHVLTDVHHRLGLPEAKTLEARASALDAHAKRRRIRPEAEQLLAEARAYAGGTRAPVFPMARRAYQFRWRLLGRPAPDRTKPETP